MCSPCMEDGHGLEDISSRIGPSDLLPSGCMLQGSPDKVVQLVIYRIVTRQYSHLPFYGVKERFTFLTCSLLEEGMQGAVRSTKASSIGGNIKCAGC